MSDLTACTVGTCYNFTIDDNSTTDSGSKCDHYDIIMTFSAALPHFSKRSHIGIISYFYENSCFLT